MPALDALLQPFEVKGHHFKNRIISTSHVPGYAERGVPSPRYLAYHEEKAKGGIAMTMFGGSSIVSAEVSPIYSQLDVSTDDIIPHLETFAARLRPYGTKLMCQISHMGRRTSWDDADWIAPIAPSSVRDPAHHAVPRAMEIEDIERIIAAYGNAARRCAEGGLDGVEVMVPSHLPGQFLSPEANRRDDEYGGSLENRMRFLRRIMEDVRGKVPASFLVSVRMAMDEANEGGATRDELITVAKMLRQADLIDLLNLIGHAATTTRVMADVIAGMARPMGGFLDHVRAFREAVGMPVIHAGRMPDLATAAHAVSSGAVDFVGMTRAHMADPHIVRKLQRGMAERIRPCVGAAYCIDRIYVGRVALCLHNAATGREHMMPQEVPRSTGPLRKIVVVGGGPAGMEAARVAALRGHKVVLFEAAGKLGGQVLLAAKAGWRRDLIGIVDWLAAEIQALGVEVKFGTFAEDSDVLAEMPDVVMLATGGVPRVPEIGRADLAVSSWEVLSQGETVQESYLIYDEEGAHTALSLADHLSRTAKKLILATADRQVGRNTGGSSYPVYLANLAKAGAEIVTDMRLQRIEREGNKLRATLRHEYGDVEKSWTVDQVVTELGTVPNDGLFHALKARSRNKGIIDPTALVSGAPQPAFTMPSDGFILFAVGDAVASRDIHAAIFDSLRLMKDC